MNTVDVIEYVNGIHEEVTGEGGDYIKHKNLMERITRGLDQINKVYAGAEHPTSRVMASLESRVVTSDSGNGKTSAGYDFGEDIVLAQAVAVYSDLTTAINVSQQMKGLADDVDSKIIEIEDLKKRIETLEQNKSILIDALEHFWTDSYTSNGIDKYLHDGSIRDYVKVMRVKKGFDKPKQKSVDDLPKPSVLSAADYEKMILGD
ncbi:hypothetical protein vBYenM636_47 [Yersinia phage vB_YenM_636]|nr:hypothetical protein X1_10 [Yersinia phage vB_Yen_X1]QKN86298.1 hypothetical protein vBYenM12_47 [Yersinia phage vB_YenM_12]QKN86389.1 hypothetical protein vBYenM22_47 [Yersinia phage vB_YenM_22]QKN86480.1 hypothetical protein vBYenM25_47 [Yersinia phage vB_YenM_25]QKN86571.1 hypothetical protein vBYenM27_47 [Yersinia phage vB_YenM_27]QKN86662.1 hypothetical protein vBYenM39_47 [Yersinia phage vB_YenM_39]QKN86753.1 hypothetical protein vBYenM126_47 [Yersinia phage vB_YenM_126]QKN86844.1 h